MAVASQTEPSTRDPGLNPRRLTLVLGVAYAVLTAAELLSGDWRIGGSILLQRTTKMNLLHWAVALGLLGGRVAGPDPGRRAALIVGSLLLLLGLWGLFASEGLGGAFGFGTGVPLSYSLIHTVTGAIALSGVFWERRNTA